jgi:transposase-like protein
MLRTPMDDDARSRYAAVRERLSAAAASLAETAAMPRPEAGPADRAAYVAERWRQLGERTVIPPDVRPRLLEMLAGGTTISAVAEAFGVKRWEARKWLARLGFEGIADVGGEGKARRWVLATPPGDGDAQ